MRSVFIFIFLSGRLFFDAFSVLALDLIKYFLPSELLSVYEFSMEENRITKKVELQREQQNSFSIGPLLYVPKIVEQTLVVTQFFFPFLLNFGSSFSFCKDYLVVEKSCLPDSFFSGGWRQQ